MTLVIAKPHLVDRADVSRLSPRVAMLGAWLIVGAWMSLLWLNGLQPLGDFDDFLKLHEIRHVLTTGSLLDRQLPNILQPEPFFSHWTWISDAPYALIAMLVWPIAGLDAGIQVAAFIVPLLLFLCAIVLIYKTAILLGFANPGLVAAVGSILITFLEFQPGRVDYHNVQMLLLAGIVLCVGMGGLRAAIISGLLTALSFSISVELAFHVVLVMTIYAARFVFAADRSSEEIAGYGLALLGGSVATLIAVNPTGPWLDQLCDRYSLAHMVALCGAGATFAFAGGFLGARHWTVKATLLGVAGAATAVVVAKLFPQCLGGPYASMSPYAFENLVVPINQEKSFFAIDVPLPMKLSMLWSLFGAALVVVAVATGAARTRAWIVVGLFAALSVVLALAYTRYVRFVPTVGWPGMILLIGSCFRIGSVSRARLSSDQLRSAPGFLKLFLPVFGAGALLLAVVTINPGPQAKDLGTDIAGFCAKVGHDERSWPAGARVLGPPLITNAFLHPGGPDLVSIPFHTASLGLERTFRFFDPTTTNPRAWLDQSKATHVVVCGFDNVKSVSIRRDFPFAVSLVDGKPPAWLTLCPAGKNDILRIYTYGPDALCPAPVDRPDAY